MKMSPVEKASRFVVQEHHAKNIHWDFRLEMNGVLKSWAVPKQIPKEAGVKRLAIQTGDHELSYLDFEGDIPEGMYGAGKVIIRDRGTYNLIESDERKILLALQGKNLNGKYCLIRFEKGGSDSWLLFKVGE